MINNIPRVRFAPSPTGYLHVGGLRTALYNYLFARNSGGKFILRIEDTDRNRYIPGAIENLISTLKWAEIDYDEGPDIGGENGPYLQSERLDIYKEHADILIKNKKAYYCFCSAERLASLREEQQKQNIQTKYDKHCLNLSDETISQNLSKGLPHVVRLNVEPGKIIKFRDHIREEVEFSSEVVDDQVLIKSDKYPTYHLANVVDDHLMKITHVIRGEEWLSSTPKHIILYEAFGWEIPVFAHLPLLLNADRSKLSKRQGDVAVEDYRNKGYLKEALINFVALLGWTAGDDKEYYDIDELISKFSLDRVNKSGAVFNIEKLNWLNEEHLRRKSDAELLQMLRTELSESKYSTLTYTDEYLISVIRVMKERVSFIKEILEKGYYFFEEPSSYEEAVVKKRWNNQSAEILKLYGENIRAINSPTKEDYENILKNTAAQFNTGNGDVIHPLRLAVSGIGGGPGIFDILYIIGREKTLNRINTIIEKLNK
ncbi:MAG: glutamate--tRNA ligase [Ignavibacteriaceae bacterium]|nr:glutamate--tRNA ligase [Ignavibacteriaceae bacterium]